MLPAHIAKIPYKQALERAEALIETLDIYHRKDHYPSELSGGEQQRVAIATGFNQSTGNSIGRRTSRQSG